MTTVPRCPEDAATCMDECEQLRALTPWCTTVTDAVLTCMSQQADPSFTCDEEMNPALIGDACKAEVDAMIDCFFEGPPGGLPDMGPDCTTYCAGQAALECYSPTCVDECLDSVADAKPCNGMTAATVHCVASDGAVTWSCDAPMEPTWTSEACLPHTVLMLACQALMP